MGLKQKLVRFVFRWAQCQLEPPTHTEHNRIGSFDHVPFDEVVDACEILNTYQDIEISTVTHNIGEDNEYSCVVLVGRHKAANIEA